MMAVAISLSSELRTTVTVHSEASKIIQKPKESIQEAHDEPAKAYSAEQPGSELIYSSREVMHPF